MNSPVKPNGARAPGAACIAWVVSPKDGPASAAHGTLRDELREVDGRWYLSLRRAMVEGGQRPPLSDRPK
jgi:hypothetical protein